MDDATKSLKDAIDKKDMVEIKVATELVESSRKKLNETATKMEQQAKAHVALGEKRKVGQKSWIKKCKNNLHSHLVKELILLHIF